MLESSVLCNLLVRNISNKEEVPLLHINTRGLCIAVQYIYIYFFLFVNNLRDNMH